MSTTGAVCPDCDLAGGAMPLATKTAAAATRHAAAISQLRRLNFRTTCKAGASSRRTTTWDEWAHARAARGPDLLDRRRWRTTPFFTRFSCNTHNPLMGVYAGVLTLLSIEVIMHARGSQNNGA